MDLVTFMPLLIAAALAIAVSASHRWLAPSTASRIIAVALGMLTMAVVASVSVVSGAFLAHDTSVLGGLFEWCLAAFGMDFSIVDHSVVPTWIGMLAVGWSIYGAARVRVVLNSHRRLRHAGLAPLTVAEDGRPFAYTLPGRTAHIVISTGLIDLLDEDEQRIVLAHERAHARHRHDRYLLLGELAAALVPLFRPLANRLGFSLERWADEEAVIAFGDRRRVAHTLGKVALSGTAPSAALGIGGPGIPARVAALLANTGQPLPTSRNTWAWLAVAATAGLLMVQIHHLEVFLKAFCPC